MHLVTYTSLITDIYLQGDPSKRYQFSFNRFYSSLTWLQHMHGYEELIHVEFDGIWSKNGVKLSFRPAVLAIAGMF